MLRPSRPSVAVLSAETDPAAPMIMVGAGHRRGPLSRLPAGARRHEGARRSRGAGDPVSRLPQPGAGSPLCRRVRRHRSATASSRWSPPYSRPDDGTKSATCSIGIAGPVATGIWELIGQGARHLRLRATPATLAPAVEAGVHRRPAADKQTAAAMKRRRPGSPRLKAASALPRRYLAEGVTCFAATGVAQLAPACRRCYIENMNIELRRAMTVRGLSRLGSRPDRARSLGAHQRTDRRAWRRSGSSMSQAKIAAALALTTGDHVVPALIATR